MARTNAFDRPFEHSDALLTAALREFAQHGYAQASINRILERAGMSKGQFYHHFKGKEDLYFALIGVLIERKREHLRTTMAPSDLSQDLFAILQQQVRLGIDFARRHPDVNGFAQSFAREQGKPIYAKALKRHNFNADAMIEGLIARAHHAGELRADLPLPFIQRYVGFIFTHAVEAAGLDDAASMDEIESRMNTLVMALREGLASTQERKTT